MFVVSHLCQLGDRSKEGLSSLSLALSPVLPRVPLVDSYKHSGLHLTSTNFPILTESHTSQRFFQHEALFQLNTSHGLFLAKQQEKQGGDTQGGRGWRSKLNPHVLWVEPLPRLALFVGDGGGALQTLSSLCYTFPHFSPTHCCALNPCGSI